MSSNHTRRSYYVELARAHVGDGVGRWSTRFRSYSARRDFGRTEARERAATPEIIGLWEVDATEIGEAEAFVVEFLMPGPHRRATVLDLTRRDLAYPYAKPVLVGSEPGRRG